MVNGVPITLDRERYLRFDWNRLCQLEDRLGMGLGRAIMLGRYEANLLRLLVWAGLLHEEPKLTVERAGELIQLYLEGGGSLEELNRKINEALAATKLFKAESNEASEPVPFPSESGP